MRPLRRTGAHLVEQQFQVSAAIYWGAKVNAPQ